MLAEFLKDYLAIAIFLFISLGLSILFIIINFTFSPKKPDPEKLSTYECGFEPFEDSRMEFDVRFYLVAILFIIFDLEIAFFFCYFLGTWFVWIFIYDDFFIYLTVGFVYEWKKEP